MILGATAAMGRTPTLNPSPQGGGRRRPWRFGSFLSLPLVGFGPFRRMDRSGGAVQGEKALRATLEWQEAEQGLASAKSVAKQGGGVGASAQASASEILS